MTITTIRPDEILATSGTGGITIVGSKTAPTALSDDSDASYVAREYDPYGAGYNLHEMRALFPAGAFPQPDVAANVTDVVLRCRGVINPGGATVQSSVYNRAGDTEALGVGAFGEPGPGTAAWFTFTQSLYAARGVLWGEGLAVALGANNSVTFYEAAIDVYHDGEEPPPPPVVSALGFPWCRQFPRDDA